jgi:hypothetical protein
MDGLRDVYAPSPLYTFREIVFNLPSFSLQKYRYNMLLCSIQTCPLYRYSLHSSALSSYQVMTFFIRFTFVCRCKHTSHFPLLVYIFSNALAWHCSSLHSWRHGRIRGNPGSPTLPDLFADDTPFQSFFFFPERCWRDYSYSRCRLFEQKSPRWKNRVSIMFHYELQLLTKHPSVNSICWHLGAASDFDIESPPGHGRRETR